MQNLQYSSVLVCIYTHIRARCGVLAPRGRNGHRPWEKERAVSKRQHIHEAVSDFIPRVNPRISAGPRASILASRRVASSSSPSRDSFRGDGP